MGPEDPSSPSTSASATRKSFSRGGAAKLSILRSESEEARGKDALMKLKIAKAKERFKGEGLPFFQEVIVPEALTLNSYL